MSNANTMGNDITKSNGDLSPLAQIESQKSHQKIAKRRHSADERVKKLNGADGTQEIVVVAERPKHVSRQMRDETPSSISSESQLCCPIPATMLKLRKRAVRAAKGKDPAKPEPAQERQAPLAVLDAFDDKDGNILMPSSSREILAVVEEEKSDTQSIRSIGSISIKDGSLKDFKIEELKQKLSEITAKNSTMELLEQSEDVISDLGSLPSLEFHSGVVQDEDHLPEKFDTLLNTVISKQILAKSVTPFESIHNEKGTDEALKNDSKLAVSSSAVIQEEEPEKPKSPIAKQDVHPEHLVKRVTKEIETIQGPTTNKSSDEIQETIKSMVAKIEDVIMAADVVEKDQQEPLPKVGGVAIKDHDHIESNEVVPCHTDHQAEVKEIKMDPTFQDELVDESLVVKEFLKLEFNKLQKEIVQKETSVTGVKDEEEVLHPVSHQKVMDTIREKRESESDHERHILALSPDISLGKASVCSSTSSLNTIIDATEHLENAENLEQEIENGKAEISSLEVECTSADIKPLPAEIKPIPVDIKPKPVDMKPIPADTLPLSAENKPISADTQPISTDMKPTPADTHPLSDENVHKSADIKPKKVDIKPISADTQPIANDSQENSADSLLTGQTKAQDLTTDDLVSTDETLKLISDDHTEEPDHAEHVEINDEHVEMMNEDFEMIASNGSLLLDIGSGPEDERNQAMEYGESTSETEFEIIPEPESEEYTTTQYLEYPETVVQDQKAFDEVRQEVGKVNEVSALEIVPVVHVEHEERDDDDHGVAAMIRILAENVTKTMTEITFAFTTSRVDHDESDKKTVGDGSMQVSVTQAEEVVIVEQTEQENVAESAEDICDHELHRDQVVEEPKTEAIMTEEVDDHEAAVGEPQIAVGGVDKEEELTEVHDEVGGHVEEYVEILAASAEVDESTVSKEETYIAKEADKQGEEVVPKAEHVEVENVEEVIPDETVFSNDIDNAITDHKENTTDVVDIEQAVVGKIESQVTEESRCIEEPLIDEPTRLEQDIISEVIEVAYDDAFEQELIKLETRFVNSGHQESLQEVSKEEISKEVIYGENANHAVEEATRIDEATFVQPLESEKFTSDEDIVDNKIESLKEPASEQLITSTADIVNKTVLSAAYVVNDVVLSAADIITEAIPSAADILNDVVPSTADTVNKTVPSAADIINETALSAGDVIKEGGSTADYIVNDVVQSLTNIVNEVVPLAIVHDVVLLAANSVNELVSSNIDYEEVPTINVIENEVVLPAVEFEMGEDIIEEEGHLTKPIVVKDQAPVQDIDAADSGVYSLDTQETKYTEVILSHESNEMGDFDLVGEILSELQTKEFVQEVERYKPEIFEVSAGKAFKEPVVLHHDQQDEDRSQAETTPVKAVIDSDEPTTHLSVIEEQKESKMTTRPTQPPSIATIAQQVEKEIDKENVESKEPIKIAVTQPEMEASKTDLQNVAEAEKEAVIFDKNMVPELAAPAVIMIPHLISPMSTTEQLESMDFNLPSIDDVIDDENVFKVSGSSTPFWLPGTNQYLKTFCINLWVREIVVKMECSVTRLDYLSKFLVARGYQIFLDFGGYFKNITFIVKTDVTPLWAFFEKLLLYIPTSGQTDCMHDLST